MEKYLPGQTWTLNSEDLKNERPLESLVSAWPMGRFAEPYKLELLELRGQSGASAVIVDEHKESFRPDLEFKIAYARNAIDPRLSDAQEELFRRDNKALTVGLLFKSGLNFGLQNKKIQSVDLMNSAHRQKLLALESDALVAWKDLRHEVESLKARLERTQKLVDTQKKKAKEERRRYSLGRSTAFQAITFEQESADAELALWSLLASYRKTESKARFYAR
jgi:outer membrane protein TolC